MEETELTKLVDDRVRAVLAERAYVPAPWPSLDRSEPFMQHSTPAAADFLHPRYFDLCTTLQMHPRLHRKQWEWVFIAHHLIPAIQLGSRGLGLGVGTDPMPAVFASLGACVVVADDGQRSGGLEALRRTHIIADELFDQRVSFQPCDLSNIDPGLRGFDFTWSSCAFGNLGSIEAGRKFVRDSLDTLKPGGVAVHTTDTVLFHYSDLDQLVESLWAEGHHTDPIIVAPTIQPDASTSAGLVVRKRLC